VAVAVLHMAGCNNARDPREPREKCATLKQTSVLLANNQAHRFRDSGVQVTRCK
jgi:hypothetical protein